MYNGLSLRTVFHVVFCLGISSLQVMALQAVWQVVWFPANFARWDLDDDEEIAEYYPAGLPYPTNYANLMQWYNDNKMHGLLILNVFPLLFTCVCFTIGVRVEFEQVKAGYVLLRKEAHDWIAGSSADVGGDEGLGSSDPPPRRTARAARMLLILITHYVRMSLLWYYVDITVQIMGTADGPFNMLLNAVALAFVCVSASSPQLPHPHPPIPRSAGPSSTTASSWTCPRTTSSASGTPTSTRGT